MFVKRFARLSALVLACASLAPRDAAAQSFFESLFGIGSKPKRAEGALSHGTGPRTRPVPSLGSFQRTSPAGDGGQWSASEDDQSFERAPADMGGYKTMCVRTCDGFYWPVRSGAAEGQFRTDAKLCAKSCVTEAKLYYLPRSSDNMRAATNLEGESYGELKTAFKYRKKLSSSCTCKPAPWTSAEMSRHRVYAIMEIMKDQEKRLAAERTRAEQALAEARAKAETSLAAARAATASSAVPAQSVAPVAAPASEGMSPQADDETTSALPETAEASVSDAADGPEAAVATGGQEASATSEPVAVAAAGNTPEAIRHSAEKARRQRHRMARLRQARAENKPIFYLPGMNF